MKVLFLSTHHTNIRFLSRLACLLTLLCVGLYQYSYAQDATAENVISNDDEKKHFFTTGFGITISDSRDRVASQLFRFGFGGKLALGYEFLDANQIHSVSLNAGGAPLFRWLGLPEDSFSVGGETQILLQALYSSQFVVLDAQPFRLYLGWGLEGLIDFWIPDYLNYAWSAHLGLGPAFSMTWRQQQHRLHASLFLPLIGIQSRPPHNSYDYRIEVLLEERGIFAGGAQIAAEYSQFAFWHNFFRAAASIDYSHPMTSYLDLLVTYNLEGGYYSLPGATQDKLYMHHTILVSFNWRW